MEVTEAPPAMMEVDSTILERVEKVRSGFQAGCSSLLFRWRKWRPATRRSISRRQRLSLARFVVLVNLVHRHPHPGGSNNHGAEAGEAKCDVRYVNGKNVRRARSQHPLPKPTLSHSPEQPTILPELPSAHISLLPIPNPHTADAGSQRAILERLQHNDVHLLGAL